MVQLALKPTLPDPLTRLNDLLSGDMDHVNRLILTHMDSGVPLIPQLAGYLISAGGKRIRPLLTLAATRLFDTTTTRPFALAASVEFIHTATLLHDDVVDESVERRGKPSANETFGNQASVLVGDFLFSRAFQLMVADGSLDVLRILSNASATISEGEVMQLQVASNLATTWDQYLSVINAKTAALFAAATEIGPVIASAGPDMQQALRDYGTYLGLAFQIVDDVLDYTGEQAKLGKTVGDDFREGKMTAPVIFALEKATAEDKLFWQRTLVEHDIRESDLAHAKKLMQQHGALTHALDVATKYARQAADALAPLPNSELKTLLIEIADYTVTRGA